MDTLINEILELGIAIQQIPAPTFAEEKRGQFIEDLFAEEGLLDVSADKAGNIYGRIPGSGGGAPLVICAHLDTVFPATTNLRLTRDPNLLTGPGIGDNALGVAGMIGLLWMLRAKKTQPFGDIWLVATVGEEGLGDLSGMRAVVNRFEDSPIAYLALEGMALGYIYHRALGVRRYRVSAKTAGGHSWGHYGRPSAVHELAHLIDQLTTLRLPENPRTTLNVGVFSGGTSVNTIAAEASFELDLRSESPEALTALVKKAQMLISSASKPRVKVVAEQIGSRPAGEISESHPLVKLAKDALIQQGIEPIMTIGSTDANIPLSRGYASICLGITTGDSAHTLEEFVNAAPAAKGMQQLLYFVENLWY
ncbi:MAG: M20/M25/M40 family metallo-hydrolase [Anaerolineae bacterium]|jgi:tripeptide aminopeptidase|nr:M20/M25/M40 family metallo-hydrolase [Anaerolineae bacterium]MBT7070978.1 M20/M25/M40 family metallo-hydrolase [Anaerolineae bacterium]MBT7325884.1 M20/M25/M40 family metallo-hydrolase [Anaerolineae bacterium]